MGNILIRKAVCLGGVILRSGVNCQILLFMTCAGLYCLISPTTGSCDWGDKTANCVICEFDCLDGKTENCSIKWYTTGDTVIVCYRFWPPPVCTGGYTGETSRYWIPKGPPLNVSANSQDNSTILITWTVDYASSYRIYWSTNPGVSTSNYEGVFTVSGFSSFGAMGVFVHSNLTSGKTYYYVVTSENPQGESSPSFEVNASLCTPPPSGDWILSGSCVFTEVSAAPADVEVTGGSVLTIAPGAQLDIDFINHHLSVETGSGVLVKQGGKVY